MTRKNLLFGSILLGILGFSPMLLSVINKGNKHGELKLNQIITTVLTKNCL